MFGRINDPKSYLILSLETGMKDSYTTTNSNTVINTLRPRQNGRHFTDDALKRISLYENVRMLDQVTSFYLHQWYITDAYMRHSASMGQHGISQYIFSFKKIFLDLSSLMLPSLWNREIDMHCVRIYHTNLFFMLTPRQRIPLLQIVKFNKHQSLEDENPASYWSRVTQYQSTPK